MARGRNASDPTEIPPRGWKDIAFRIKDEVAADQVGLIAAGIAFYGLLALFPAITAFIAIGGLIAEPATITDQIQSLSGLVPDAVMSIITNQAAEVAGSREGGLGLAALAGFGIALYSASKGTSSLIAGLNTAYDEEETRGFFSLLATRIILTLFIVLGLSLGLSITLAVPAVTSYLSAHPALEFLGSVVVYLLLFALAVFGLAVLYRYGTSRDNPQFEWVSLGSVLACITWIVASAGFAFYVKNFGTYNETFGTLAGVVVLLMWFWISAFIVLLGAELNAETEAQTRRDSTVGKREPMGDRDAVKADRLGSTA